MEATMPAKKRRPVSRIIDVTTPLVTEYVRLACDPDLTSEETSDLIDLTRKTIDVSCLFAETITHISELRNTQGLEPSLESMVGWTKEDLERFRARSKSIKDTATRLATEVRALGSYLNTLVDKY